jgi:hypothetical protein
MTIARGEPLLASDMLDLTFFPIGTILMYDGTNWSNGRGGWYICDGANGTPDLRDRFIKGAGSAPSTGGSNSTVLTAAMLPKHAHGFTTSSTSKTLTGNFTTSVIITGASDNGINVNSASGILSKYSSAAVLYDPAHGHTKTAVNGYKGVSLDATHTHSGTTDYSDGTTTNTNINNMPQYYSVIYIKKCV